MNRIGGVSLIVVALLVGCSAAEKRPPVPKEDLTALVRDNNDFAFALHAQLRDREGNLFYSPYSISSALAMTFAGARGDTATEMAEALRFRLEPAQLHPAFAAQIRDLNAEGTKRGYQLSVANALWGQKGYDFVPEFLKLTRDQYGAGLKAVDFAGATEDARQTINRWVEEKTNEKIQELLKQGVLTGDTRLVLTNAIHFKGDWASQFKKDLTRDDDFKTADGGKVKVPMMSQKGKFRYLETPEMQALEMPYVGKELAMVVLLPKKHDGLAALEKDLSAEKVTGWLGRMREATVQVALPKFKTTAEFTLNDALTALGMKKAFTRAADLSGINGRTDLYISRVIHKAFVDVNEQGTEAAAATAVVVETKSIRIDPVFRADHPFVFLIRDVRTGSILFLGRLARP